MTQQEQQIEEIAKIACVACAPKAYCPILPDFRPCEAAKEYAKAVHDAGYRKVDGVRKETAKDILDILYDMGINNEILECCGTFDVNGVSLVKQICEKYGVNKNDEEGNKK